MNSTFKAISCALVLTLVCGCSNNKPVPAAPEAPQVQKAPTQDEMEAAFKKMSTTTAEHDLLKNFTGTWNAATRMWMQPGTPPQESKGTSVNTLIFGGKFLKQEFSGSWMGKPMKGVGFTGYDTVAGEFTSVWLDSMSTTIMTSTGSYDDATKSITLTGEASCPLVNDKIKLRSVSRKINKNKFVFEMYSPGPDGKEFKGFEIVYTRK